ncbi:potassium channel family protein [Peptococcus niger]|uniref:Trk system potassium uptake protein TrkA n=1 Tax=Peptococcus niger TaxID=2741 RepID=A0A1G6WP53_PEPNI|nr:TrkA family potassium uptake protein [Peptococcus niger]SDD66997.1 trk system potassium uptake protein TrkA [Peptococcus niger]
MKNILLIGLGRFGRHMAQQFYAMGHEVMAVDQREERVNQVLAFVTDAQIGDSTDGAFLASLGVGNYDLCVVAIGDSFENSLVTTSLLKELGAGRVIARASRGIQERLLLRNGADEVVYPEKQLARWTAIRYSSDHILEYWALDHDYAVYELAVPEAWLGQTVDQLDLRKKYGLNILGIRYDGHLNMDIRPQTILDKGASVLVLGPETVIRKRFDI